MVGRREPPNPPSPRLSLMRDARFWKSYEIRHEQACGCAVSAAQRPRSDDMTSRFKATQEVFSPAMAEEQEAAGCVEKKRVVGLSENARAGGRVSSRRRECWRCDKTVEMAGSRGIFFEGALFGEGEKRVAVGSSP